MPCSASLERWVSLPGAFDRVILESLLTLILCLGLTGGIVQVPADCKTGDLKNGMGVTIYHFVESIEKVSHQERSCMTEL